MNRTVVELRLIPRLIQDFDDFRMNRTAVELRLFNKFFFLFNVVLGMNRTPARGGVNSVELLRERSDSVKVGQAPAAGGKTLRLEL